MASRNGGSVDGKNTESSRYVDSEGRADNCSNNGGAGRLTDYVLLPRGINVGGKNPVPMGQLKAQLTSLGFSNVSYFGNAGNLFLSSSMSRPEICSHIDDLFASEYPFIKTYALVDGASLLRDATRLPNWWHENWFRKDVLFYTEIANPQEIVQTVESMSLGDESIFFGNTAIYWAKRSKDTYRQTAFVRQVMKQAFYKQVTIRNGQTFEKICGVLRERAAGKG